MLSFIEISKRNLKTQNLIFLHAVLVIIFFTSPTSPRMARMRLASMCTWRGRTVATRTSLTLAASSAFY